MGDLLFKKPPHLPHWQSNEMLTRKVYHHPMYNPAHRMNNNTRGPFNFRPSEPRYREQNYYQQPAMYSFPPKVRDRYFLNPYYRNVMPPPPNPNRLLMIDPNRRLSGVISGGEQNHCQCRSKSMEDIRTDVEMVNDINCNYIQSSVMHNNENFKKFSNRRSMENLLIDTDYSPTSIKKLVKNKVCMKLN